MSDKIKLLPEIVANQIAAGEVVEEPASVVKEMVENAIDAGANCIKVNFRNGGVDLIQIIDDGCGMSPFDARLAFDRHTTSKIRTVEDIYGLHTFGFRGEALASIAAVAQVELKTRQKYDEIGVETIVNGGQFISQKPVMTPVGSQFSVSNLFYNVPARRKFLNKTAELASKIKSEFKRAALCNPQVAFELYSNNEIIFNLPKTSLAGRIIDVVGQRIKNNLLEIDADTSIVKIKGFVGRPAEAKRRNSEQYLFVNGRFFKSTYLYKAIMKAYEKLIPDNCYPSYFIYIEVDPSRVDVNVSPKKTEVKFADLESIWQILNAAVRETLAKTGAVSLMDFDNESDIEIPVSDYGTAYPEPRAASDENYNPFLIPDDDEEQQPTRRAAVYTPRTDFRGSEFSVSEFTPEEDLEYIPSNHAGNGFDEAFEDIASGSDLLASSEMPSMAFGADEEKSFGEAVCVGSRYAAAKFGKQFVFVDLKRAKERILYENYMMLMSGSSSVSQQLLFPERLVLSNEEYDLVLENASLFADLGFDIEFEGDGAIIVKGTPVDTGSESIDRLIFELLKVFDTPESAIEVRKRDIAAAMARSGSSLPKNITDEAANMLLTQLAACENISFAPSGKAIIAQITPDDMKAKLG